MAQDSEAARNGLFFSIRAKMLIYFGVLLVAALVAVSLAYMYGLPFVGKGGVVAEHREAAFKSLDLVADLKKERLLRWLQERKDDSAILADGVLTGRRISELLGMVRQRRARGAEGPALWDGIRAETVYRELVSHLRLVMDTYGVYELIDVVDAETNTIVLTTHDEDLGLRVAGQAMYDIRPRAGGVAVYFHREVRQTLAGGTEPVSILHVARGLSDAQGRGPAGAFIVMHMGEKDFLGPFLHTGGGLGRTGEALLVDQDTVILSSLMHPLPDGSKARPLNYRISASAARLASEGREGIIASLDYRGVPVLAAYRHLRVSPGVGWGMVVKVDSAEVVAPLKSQALYIAAVGLAAIVSALCLAYFISLRLSRPIHSLSQVALRVRDGDLGARAEVGADDEVGALAETFNSMLEGIEASRDELQEAVRFRTEKLNVEMAGRRKVERDLGGAEDRLSSEIAVGRMLADISRSLSDPSLSLGDLARTTLEHARALTGSEHGYVSSIDPVSGDNIAHTLSPMMGAECTVTGEDRRLVFPKGGDGLYPSLWGHVLNTREPFFTNSPSASPASRGLPEGHVGLRNFLSVPAVSGEELVGQIALANSTRDYTDRDLRLIGRLAALYAVAMQRFRTEESLRRRARHNQQLLDAFPCFAVMLRRDHTIVAQNEVSRLMEGVIGRTCFSTLAKRDRPCPWCRASLALGSGELQNVKVWGGDIYWDAYWIPLEDDLYLHFAFDITEQKRLKDQLAQSRKMEAIGHLAGGVAHDFNNILTAIMGYANILQMKVGSDGVLSPLVANIVKASARATEFTRSLMAFSRRQVINPRPVDLNSLVAGSEKLLRGLLGEGVELEFNLKPRAGGLVVKVDAGQFEQVLMNLASNAKAAMPGGGRITVSTEEVRLDKSVQKAYDVAGPGRYALLKVSDTGEGMDAETLQRVFEPFFTTRDVGADTGLGLAIVYGIVRQHEGYMEVQSAPGAGSTFSVFLPLSVARAEVVPPDETRMPESGSEVVLLAEDDEEVRTLMRDVLTEYGYTVIEAVDGIDAIEKFKSNRERIQLLLLDVIMPGLNGRQVYDQARKLRPDIKTLFTSGYTEDIIGEKGVLEEGLEFIPKPATPAEMLGKVREVLDKGSRTHPAGPQTPS